MLGKLMKFDLKSSYRAFVGIYAAIFLMAVLLGTTIRLQNEWLFVFVPLALMAVVIASAVIAFLGILKLFNDSVYTAQGYLTLSLPVRAEAVVASKCLVALIWLLLLLIVGAASVAVFDGIAVDHETEGSHRKPLRRYCVSETRRSDV